MLLDFMNNLGCSSGTGHGDKTKQILLDYVKEKGYGLQYYTSEDVETMHKEIAAITCFGL